MRVQSILWQSTPGCSIAASAALLLALCAASWAEGIPSVEELVSKHIAAMGGSEKIRALRSFKATGRMIDPGGREFPLTIYIKNPDSTRTEVSIDGKTVVHCSNGTEVWAINPLSGSEEPVKGDEAERLQAREGADTMFASDLFEYKARGSSLEFAGTAEAQGWPAYKLKLVTKHGTVKYIYLDRQSFLELRVFTVRGQAGQEEGDAYLSDYRTVDGVMVPYSAEEHEGGTRMKVVLDKVEANPAIDDSIFRFPGASKRAPLPKRPWRFQRAGAAGAEQGHEQHRPALEDAREPPQCLFY